MNKALLGKWGLRFAFDDNSSWKKLIRQKYHTKEGGWFTRDPKGSYGVGLWKDISTRCEEGPLCELFLSLYALADSKGAIMTDVWENLEGSGMWIPRLVRAFK